MTREAMLEMLQYRIESDIAHLGGALPDRNALAWRGYLVGLLEWSVIDRSMFDLLAAKLPRVDSPLIVPPETQRSPSDTELVVRELKARIKKDIGRHHGKLPEQEAIFWHAYLAGLLEWFVIYSGFRRLTDLLPEVEDDPVEAILLGRSPPGGDTA